MTQDLNSWAFPLEKGDAGPRPRFSAALAHAAGLRAGDAGSCHALHQARNTRGSSHTGTRRAEDEQPVCAIAGASLRAIGQSQEVTGYEPVYMTYVQSDTTQTRATWEAGGPIEAECGDSPGDGNVLVWVVVPRVYASVNIHTVLLYYDITSILLYDNLKNK